MESLKITFEIDLWDCFLYSGYLFTLTPSNDLEIYDWNALIEALSTADTHLALNAAFVRGDLTSSGTWKLFYKSSDYLNALRKSLKAAASNTYSLNRSFLQDFLIDRSSQRTTALADCMTVYDNSLYYGTENGVYADSFVVEKRAAKMKRKKANKFWDGAAVDLVGGGYGTIAIAASAEGAFQHYISDLREQYADIGTICLSEKHTTSIAFLSADSLFRTSLLAEGEIIARAHSLFRDQYDPLETVTTTLPGGNYDFTWGGSDSIFAIRNDILYRFSFSQRSLNSEYKKTATITPTSSIGAPTQVRFQPWKGRVLEAQSSSFGTVVECENALVIVFPNGTILTLHEEFARWRIYTKSKHYRNQLHIINESDFAVLAFTDHLFTENNWLPNRPVNRIR